ncbi:hypothetical protein [Eoetvoesiella caeni]|uniref:Uncharacterized protein n=1 Tax=Eoetvoesiella caeni TaxID=645616 RepID=A0A366HDL5_9BURK|nr:hypothetical protein [Eoetvoesiella caeni]MCI2809087.1 hypothetical protein [Eoetvoesiella caeni]NYT55412.1 hypothetical protein [Eoetvoesiella caeni]RBP39966.1 hypothetical protein DFR37_10460 [Eoetvoesiella caeni]
MNETFVLEPKGFSTELELKMVLGRFGSYSGRYLARYPHAIREHIKKSMDGLSELQLKRMSSILRSADEANVFQLLKNLSWKDSATWYDNAIQTVRNKATNGLVTFNLETDETASIYHVGDVAEWGPAEERILGTKEEYVRVSRTLLLTSPEIYFIDPYINPLKDSYYETMLAYLTLIAENRRCSKICFIARESNVIGNEPADVTREAIREKLLKLNRGAKIQGKTTQFCLARDEREDFKMHGRYLLTRRGGLQLDQGFQKLPRRRVDVAPISKNRLDELWSSYITGQPFQRTIGEPISV